MGKLNFKIGQRVWWNDPAGETSGYYTIDSDVQNDVWELQEQGGDDRSILSDLIIEISNEAGSEAQVHAHELRYVYEGCYRELSDRQSEIHRDLEAFIRQHINESGGRITLIFDEEKRLSC